MSPVSIITLLIVVLCTAPVTASARPDSLMAHADLPVINNSGEIVLDVFFAPKIHFKGMLEVVLYRYTTTNDSLAILRKTHAAVTLTDKIKVARLNFDNLDSATFCDPGFNTVMKKIEAVPPGDYKIYIKLADTVFCASYFYHVDSVLSPNSPMRKSIDNTLLPKKHSLLGIPLNNPSRSSKAKAGLALNNTKGRTDKALRRRGLDAVHVKQNDKSYIDLYHKKWFVGRYEVKNQATLSSQINVEAELARSTNYMSISTNDLGSPSLISQFKTFNRQQRGKDEIKGQISLNTVAGNGQEENSGMSNNYYEVRGTVGMPILGIPFDLEGLYTSQDNGRKIKSSYFRVHYDVNTVKDNLLKYISSYNSKFAESASKKHSTEMIYNAALNRWKEQRSKIQKELDVEKSPIDTAAVARAIDTNEGQADTTKQNNRKKKLEAARDKKTRTEKNVLENEKKLREKEQEIKKLDEKIKKYEALLAQNKNTNYFDSAMGYAQTKDIDFGSNMTYKQLAKKSTGILPNGEAKKMITGLTTFDAGLFSKSESRYTMAGQQIKGADAGYDIGFAEIGATVGKTEYVGRDGILDKYTCYSLRASARPAEDHKVDLIYYSYSADRRLYQGEGFFSNINISTPTFFQPVHIGALAYTGTINKTIAVNTEVASSFKRSDTARGQMLLSEDKMAYHFSAEGNIPKTPVALEAGYNRTGKQFENSTIPLSLKGVEQYKVQGRSDILRSTITLGIEYNYLIQNNLSSKGRSTKWGFDAKTNFKRYPNIALSYKPFASFHSYTDTLAIPQRPLLGSVVTGRATYQLRRSGRTLRFQVLYTANKTTMDTAAYSNTLLQGTCMYNDKKISGTLAAGVAHQSSSGSVATQAPEGNMKFINISTGYAINRTINISAGQDVGFASFGMCRYAANASVLYQSTKVPFVVRVCGRFNTYQVEANAQWKQLVSGNMEITYRFKGKLK